MKYGVLSDKTIKRYLGKKIYIWPFDSCNLKSSSYNLTASEFAFIETKKILKDNNGIEYTVRHREFIVNGDDLIKIPPNETALIQTQESILVSGDICGTYHSRVKLVNLGVGHIGTTLDPHYFGTSLIALHNIHDYPIEIKIGDSIATLMFYRVSQKSKKLHDNQPGRADLISLSDIKDFYYKFYPNDPQKDLEAKNQKLNELNVWRSASWRLTEFELKNKLKDYMEQFNKDKKIFWINLTTGILQLITVIISILVFYKVNQSNQNSGFINTLFAAGFPMIVAIFGWIRGIFINHIKRKRI